MTENELGTDEEAAEAAANGGAQAVIDGLPEPFKGLMQLLAAGIGDKRLGLIVVEDSGHEMPVPAPHDIHGTFGEFLDSLNDQQLKWFHTILHVCEEDIHNLIRIDGMVAMAERERERSLTAFAEALRPTASGKRERDERIDGEVPAKEDTDG